jgi:acid phosphatase (class A)
MNQNRFPIAAGLLCVAACAIAPLAVRIHAAEHEALIFDPAPLNLGNIVPPPPGQESETAKAELAALHQIEQTRTSAQIAAAQADDHEEDIFSYRTVLGDAFTAANFPLTATLSARVHREEPAASDPLKTQFHRPRPYQADSTLHAVCPTTTKPNSYPSGHTISGYLEAFTLASMIPEKREQILARADEYAHNRLVCGVHYPSDLMAGRQVAYAVFGALMTSPEFQRELAGARVEVRKKLGMN